MTYQSRHSKKPREDIDEPDDVKKQEEAGATGGGDASSDVTTAIAILDQRVGVIDSVASVLNQELVTIITRVCLQVCLTRIRYIQLTFLNVILQG